MSREHRYQFWFPLLKLVHFWDLIFTSKKGHCTLGMRRSKTSLAAVTLNGRAQNPERREQGRKQFTTSDFKRADSNPFRVLLEIVPWVKGLEGRSIWETWLFEESPGPSASEACLSQ